MNYWLGLFTGETWEEFRKAGAKTSGFRESRRTTVQRVRAGDVFLCYLTGVMRWVGALEVIGPSKEQQQNLGIRSFSRSVRGKAFGHAGPGIRCPDGPI